MLKGWLHGCCCCLFAKGVIGEGQLSAVHFYECLEGSSSCMELRVLVVTCGILTCLASMCHWHWHAMQLMRASKIVLLSSWGSYKTKVRSAQHNRCVASQCLHAILIDPLALSQTGTRNAKAQGRGWAQRLLLLPTYTQPFTPRTSMLKAQP